MGNIVSPVMNTAERIMRGAYVREKLTWLTEEDVTQLTAGMA